MYNLAADSKPYRNLKWDDRLVIYQIQSFFLLGGKLCLSDILKAITNW